MDPILSIIKYVFSRKNAVNNDKSINDFFSNGISFPQFISLVFDIPEIPQIDKNPKTLIEKVRNNNIALQYACQKNELIRKSNPSYLNDSDKVNLLMLILTKQRFKISIDDIFDKCNLIVQTLNIQFVEKKDIMTLNCILSLLHVLTDRYVPIPNDLNQTKKIDKLLKNSFKKANVPLIINENSFSEESQDIFLIQLEIIFEIFSKKVNLIQNSSQKAVNEQKSDTETKFKLSNYKPKVFIENHQQFSSIIENEKQALLKTLNFIGKDKFHFDNFQETVFNDTIPKFVLYFFNIQAIDNVHINESKSLQAHKNTKITKEENSIKSIQIWENEFENIQKNISKSRKEPKNTSFVSQPSTVQSRIYKFFYFDEKINDWCFDSKMYEQFLADKSIDLKKSKNPLIFIMNSFEQDSITMISKLIDDSYPKIEENDDQIFVYGFCDKSLSNLNSSLGFRDEAKDSKKPLFLLLHVPKSKQNLPNLQSIIFQIYLYFFLICDLLIVILDKHHYNNQKELTKSLLNVNSSIKSMRNSTEKMFVPKFVEINMRQENKDEEEDLAEPLEEEEIFEEEEDKLNIGNIKIDDKEMNQLKSKYIEILRRIKGKILGILFLFNDETVNFNDDLHKNFKNNKFFSDIIHQFNDVKVFISYINVNDSKTYGEFLNVLNDFVIHSKSSISNIKCNFQCNELLKFSQAYIRLRCKSSVWKEELKKDILKRYSIFESSQFFKSNLFSILTNITNEIYSISPIFDNDFINECNLILSEIKSNSSKKYHEIYKSELQNSSKLYLDYLTKKINSKFYWTEEQMHLMINAHIIFLKNEFFDIIKWNSNEKKYNMVYEDNYDVLENQIKNDKVIINAIFKDFFDKINIKKNPKKQDIKEDIKKGTNYSMKETENLREIKVTVQMNKDLKTEIEQDF